MTSRFWFYLAVVIALVGLLVFGLIERAKSQVEVSRIDHRAQIERTANMSTYLQHQTDEIKLIRLAKQLKNSQPELVGLVADRAYAINPNSRDVLVLDSYFHPELTSKLLEVDPLYSAAETQE